MPNILERYFKETSRRIPSQSIPSSQLPRPEYPEYEGFDPTELDSDNADLIPVEDGWSVDQELSFPLSNEDRDHLDGGVRQGGFDVYAFYKSRRYVDGRPYPGKWGIFYLEHGVRRIKELIEATYPG
jgi:hypothetical protein